MLVAGGGLGRLRSLLGSLGLENIRPAADVSVFQQGRCSSVGRCLLLRWGGLSNGSGRGRGNSRNPRHVSSEHPQADWYRGSHRMVDSSPDEYPDPGIRPGVADLRNVRLHQVSDLWANAGLPCAARVSEEPVHTAARQQLYLLRRGPAEQPGLRLRRRLRGAIWARLSLRPNRELWGSDWLFPSMRGVGWPLLIGRKARVTDPAQQHAPPRTIALTDPLDPRL